MTNSKMILKNPTYDKLKSTVTLVLPALGALYFALAKIWGLPFAEEIVGSLAALATFGGVMLKVSENNYQSDEGNFDGTVKTLETPKGEPNDHFLEFNAPLDELTKSKTVTLRVDNSR